MQDLAPSRIPLCPGRIGRWPLRDVWRRHCSSATQPFFHRIFAVKPSIYGGSRSFPGFPIHSARLLGNTGLRDPRFHFFPSPVFLGLADCPTRGEPTARRLASERLSILSFPSRQAMCRLESLSPAQLHQRSRVPPTPPAAPAHGHGRQRWPRRVSRNRCLLRARRSCLAHRPARGRCAAP